MFAGVSRSVSVVIMHFIGKYHMHLKNAYNHIHAARYVLLAIRLSSLHCRLIFHMPHSYEFS